MNILIPIAGEDKFFRSDEYFFPKPLVEIAGTPMIELCVRSLTRQFPQAHFIFVVQAEHCTRFSLDGMLRILTEGRCTVLRLDHATRGALCSALMAIDHIAADEPLVVANGDQIVEADLSGFVARATRDGHDGAVITFESLHPRWSFARVDGDGLVCETAEKRVISRTAIAGFYYYKSGKVFVDAALRTLEYESGVEGAYYISQTLNNLILEGRKIAAHRIPADRYHSFYSPQKVQEYERHLQQAEPPQRADSTHKINVVIPMAGEGSRFVRAGYAKPKPFIDVAGRTMIETVMANLALDGARYILLARKEHIAAEPETVRRLLALGNVEFLSVDGLTEGTACTVLHARGLIDNDTPLLIANCDQVVDFSCEDFVADCWARNLDGSILCFEDSTRDPKWSFAKTRDDGLVTRVAEKIAISDLATVGLYLFRRGADFVAGAVDMIARNERVNNEFYTCPVYNHVIANGGRIGVHEVRFEDMHGLGVPDDLIAYLKLVGSERALA
ncbi:MAG TPA: glycosyltransferase family 2 protein [Rhizomicrobium sp.]|jgi:NDP-sugar pyrophosphorylase family protein